MPSLRTKVHAPTIEMKKIYEYYHRTLVYGTNYGLLTEEARMW
jgi:hypothetical protein